MKGVHKYDKILMNSVTFMSHMVTYFIAQIFTYVMQIHRNVYIFFKKFIIPFDTIENIMFTGARAPM